jgi:hypothetical protein
LTPVNCAAGCVLSGSISTTRAAVFASSTASHSLLAAELSTMILAGVSQFSFALRQAWRSVWRQSSTNT